MLYRYLCCDDDFNLRNDTSLWPKYDALVRLACNRSVKIPGEHIEKPLHEAYTISDEAYVR